MKKVPAMVYLTKTQPIDATDEQQDKPKYLGKSVRCSKKARAHFHNSPYKRENPKVTSVSVAMQGICLIDLEKEIRKIEDLLESEGNVNAKNGLGQTPLHIICGLLENNYGEIPQCRILFNSNDQMTFTLKKNMTLLDCKIHIKKELECVQTFFTTSNEEFVSTQNLYYIDNKKSTDYINKGIELYDRAIQCCQSLLETDDIQVDAKDHKGMTPLHIACKKDNTDRAVTLLLDHGADINAEDNKKNTPTHYCCNTTNKNENWATLLKIHESQPDLKKKNNDGDTVLHIACRNKCQKIIPSIIADTLADHANNQGETALHIACNNGDTSTALCLIVDAIAKTSMFAIDNNGKRPNLCNLIKGALPVLGANNKDHDFFIILNAIKSVKAVNLDNTMNNEKYLDVSDISETSNISDSIIRHWQENWGSDLKFFNVLFRSSPDRESMCVAKVRSYLANILLACGNAKVVNEVTGLMNNSADLLDLTTTLQCLSIDDIAHS